MKKKIIIPVAIILVIALIPTIIIMRKSASSQGSLSSASKMETALKTINKNLKDTLPSLEVTTIDTKDAELVSSYTYLSNPSVVESLVVSEPLITSQAYLAILLKVKDTANVETVKEELLNNLNMNRWICVSAEKLYITNNGCNYAYCICRIFRRSSYGRAFNCACAQHSIAYQECTGI